MAITSPGFRAKGFTGPGGMPLSDEGISAHDLVADPDTLAPESPASACSQNHLLTAGANTCTPEALATAISQAHALSAAADALSPESPDVAILQVHALAGSVDTLQPEAVSGAISISHVLTAEAANGLIEALSGAIEQVHHLAIDPDTITPQSPGPPLISEGVLPARMYALRLTTGERRIITITSPRRFVRVLH